MTKKHVLIQSFTKHDLPLFAREAAKEILGCDVDLIVMDDGDIVLSCDCNFDGEKAEDIFGCTSTAKIEFLDGYCMRENGETNMTQQQTAFIAVFRPHQRPAWAQVFESEQAFIDAWANGYFDSSCHANNDLEESEREHTFYNAWHDAGHDLHALTRLDSAEEVASYLSDSEYAGHHNKGLGQVERCAKELGWIVDEEGE